MEKIKKLIGEFLKSEAETIYLMRQPNIEAYNNSLQKMNDFCVESLYNKFGMIPLRELDDQEYYDKWSKKKYPSKRHIYKISHYKDAKYGDVYVVYISERNPDDEIFLYGECLFVANINNEFKIIKNYTFGDDMSVKDKFQANQGLKDVSFETLEKPINIERYLEPLDDKDAMEHYLNNI